MIVLCTCAVGVAIAAPEPGGADFGSPPSGEIPILYNDHTVYTKPDILKRSRVLAALVKGGHVYVPLRSMFEQMGATVSVSDDGQTITASKTGASVSVTLRRAEVVVNGETRPLDVPPMIYKGVVLVPVRVISEALGAYVLWVGMPIMGPNTYRANMVLINSLFLKVAQSVPGMAFLPTWDLFANVHDQYANAAPVNRVPSVLRATDGIHFSLIGENVFATYVTHELGLVYHVLVAPASPMFIDR